MICSLQPSHSDCVLEHVFGALLFVSDAFNMNFPSMIRLNNIIEVREFVAYDTCRAFDGYWTCMTLRRTLRRNDVPLDWQRSQTLPIPHNWNCSSLPERSDHNECYDSFTVPLLFSPLHHTNTKPCHRSSNNIGLLC